MRRSGLWLGGPACLVLAACAGTPSQSQRDTLAAPQPRDCVGLFPYQEAPLPVLGAGILPADLAAAGARSLASSRFHKCVQDNLADRDHYLQALSEELSAENRHLQDEVASYEQRSSAAQAASADYNAACKVQGLGASQYQACLQREQQLNQEIADVNAAYAVLQSRKVEQDAKIAAYNQGIRTLPGDVQAAYRDYQGAVRNQEHWLDMTRALIASPANQRPVAAAACPQLQQPGMTLPEMDALTEALVACLRRMPASLLVPAPPPTSPAQTTPTAADRPLPGELDSRASRDI